MDKKTIASKTILFIFIVGFVIAFKSIFGEENTLVGVTTITAILMFLPRDLTLSPIKNTLRLIALNLFIGIASVLAASNIYLAIPVNFITMFIISYLLCYKIKNPMYLPFSLQYLFILTNPVQEELILVRFLALIAGAVLIMLSQMLVNKNKVHKSGNKILVNVCDETLEKIEILRSNGHLNKDKIDINPELDIFRSMIYDKREADYYLTEEARIKLNISVALESINMLLDRIDNYKDMEFIVYKLKVFLLDVKQILENDNSEEQLENHMKELFIECEKRDIKDLYSLQILDSIILLCDTTKELKQLNKQDFNRVKRIEEKPEVLKKRLFDMSVLKKQSLRYSYAIRIATAITIGGFIMDYFKLSEGRWILFTLLSVINPIYEVSKTKTVDRIIATLLGAVIVSVLFSIFKDPTSRSLLVMLSGYIGSYLNTYRYTTITTTISAIGSAAIIGNAEVLSASRIILVVFGVALALLINKYILPYSLKDSNKELKEMYSNITKQMFKEIYNLVDGKVQTNYMKNLFIISRMIEDKSRTNTEIESNENYDKLINEKRLVITNIYELYMWIKKQNINPNNTKCILSSIEELMGDGCGNYENKIHIIKSYIDESKDLNTKITLSSILIILEELNEIDKLNLEAKI